MSVVHDIVPAYGEPTGRVDLGDGRELLRFDNGQHRFAHTCDRGHRGVIRCAPLLSPGHTVTADLATVTVRASVLCEDCGAHGFITDGRWEAC